MDTTYWKRGFGVMVFKNSLDGVVLFKQYVRYETNALYLSGIEEIRRRGIYIQAIVCDGRQTLTTIPYNVYQPNRLSFSLVLGFLEQ